jgi:ribosome-binding factor A
MAEKRIRQISSDIRELVATLLSTGRLTDPRLRGVTIIDVKVSPDLQLARVYFSVLAESGNSPEEAQKGFKSASGFIRKHLGDVLKLRYTPNLVFHFDEALARATRMNSVLSDVRREREEFEAQAPAEDSSDESSEKQ